MKTADVLGKALLPGSFRLEARDDFVRQARKINLWSGFNGWQKTPMNRDGKHWMLNVDLPAGTYLYKFEVDDSFMIDPTQPRATNSEESIASVPGPLNHMVHSDGRQVIRQFVPKKGRQSTIHHYALYLPQGYASEPDKYWPTILFLHGAGERGDDIATTLLRQDLPKKLSEGAQMPFIVVSPHCPRTAGWGDDETNQDSIEILDEVLKTLRADPKRVYLSGFSMGGYGCWALAAQYPQRFAALVPVCGGGYQEWARATAHIPQWAFTNRFDPIVPYQSTNAMVQLCKKAGANIRFTVYDAPLRPQEPHDSWTQAYQTQELYEWMLQHTLA